MSKPSFDESFETVYFRLNDAVVIIDEAHNLIETINEIHSLTIQEKDCVTTHRKLSLYLRKVFVLTYPISFPREVHF